jgi:hypothetical protein
MCTIHRDRLSLSSPLLILQSDDSMRKLQPSVIQASLINQASADIPLENKKLERGLISLSPSSTMSVREYLITASTHGPAERLAEASGHVRSKRLIAASDHVACSCISTRDPQVPYWTSYTEILLHKGRPCTRR